MYKAKIAIQLLKFDQKNLALKIEEWKRLNSDEYHFFQPYVSETKSVETISGETSCAVKLTHFVVDSSATVTKRASHQIWEPH